MSMKKKKKKSNSSQMPSLTIDGKRQIIKIAVATLGQKQVTTWLQEHNIESLKYFSDHVRRYGPKYFRELYRLSKNL